MSDPFEIEVLSTQKFEEGYEVRTCKVTMEGNPSVEMKMAYTEKGDYIGDPEVAKMLYEKGIQPELKNEDSNTCTIGFSPKEKKWYAWSHRAIYGFGVGDVVKEGDCTASSGWSKEWLKEHPEDDRSLPVGFKAKTLEDAKKMAVAFADSVNG